MTLYTHYSSEQLVGTSTPISRCAQPVMAHPTDQTNTSFDVICLRQGEHSTTEGDMDRSLIDKTIFNTEMDSFFEVSPISPDFIPSMDRQDSKVSTEQSETPSSSIGDGRKQQQPEALTIVGRKMGGDINPFILPPESPIELKQLVISKVKNKRKQHLKGIAPLEIPNNDEDHRGRIYESRDIPEEFSEFSYEGTVVPVHVDQLNNRKFLDQGAFGQVSSVTIKGSSNLSMAVKCVSRTGYNEVKKIKQLHEKHSPYIIEYYGVVAQSNSDNVFIGMELMNASLKAFSKTMHTSKHIRPAKVERLARRIIHDVASALQTLHEEHILHQDIKPANVLINEKSIVKLCDFGVSRTLDELRSNPELIAGTGQYMPPERKVCIQDDMWALGISLVEFLSKRHPFARLESGDLPFAIYNWTPVVPETISPDLQALLLHLLKKKTEDRPGSYAEILNYPIIRNVPTTPTDSECKFVRRVLGKIR